MADTQLADGEIGIVYGAASGFLRRIYTSDSGGPSVPEPVPAEALLVRNRDKLPDLSLETLRAEIAVQLGAPVLDYGADRTVVIDPKVAVVVGVLKADPAIDTIPGFDLKLHPEADAGDRYDAKTDSYLRPYAVVDSKTGIVTAIDYLALPSRNPTAPQPDQVLVTKGGLVVGDQAFDPNAPKKPTTQPAPL